MMIKAFVLATVAVAAATASNTIDAELLDLVTSDAEFAMETSNAELPMETGSDEPAEKTYPSCPHSVRKPWEALSCSERDDFLAAARALKDDADLWGDFAEMHFANNIRSHGADQFLPWHRWFLWVFEKELQRVSGKCVTLPYWSWENDVGDKFHFASGTSGPGSTAEYLCDDVWSPEAIATNEGRIGLCTNPRFAVGQNGVLAAEACCGCGGGITGEDGVCRDRLFDTGTMPASNPNAAIFNGDAFGSAVAGCAPDGLSKDNWIPRNPDENECLRRSFFGFNELRSTEVDLAQTIFNNPRYANFRVRLEGTPHAQPHNWVGGTMGSHYSPDDPIFFLHHVNVDRLWALWQDVHDGDLVNPEDAGEDQYSGPCNNVKCQAAATADSSMDDPMPFLNPLRLDFTAPGRQTPPTPRDMLASYGGINNVTYVDDEIALLLSERADYNVNPDWVTPAAFVSQVPADGSCTVEGGLVPAPEEPEVEICLDLKLDNGDAWHAFEIIEYDCQFFEDGNYCGGYGNRWNNSGLVANTACCACGGGSTELSTETRRRSSHAGHLHFRSKQLTKLAAELEETLDVHDTKALLNEMHKQHCDAIGNQPSVPKAWIEMNGMKEDDFRCMSNEDNA